MEDLNIPSMLAEKTIVVNGKVISAVPTHRSIGDVAWLQFSNQLKYKAEEAGSSVVLVNPKNTTQNCSGCGKPVKKDLGVRIHKCPHCGLELDRDDNASLNILSVGLHTLASRKIA
jgi:putative transposase